MAAPSRMVGHDRFLKALERLPEAAKAAAAKGLDEGADQMVRMAKNLVPEEEGALRASIREELGEHPLERVVEAGGQTTTRPVRDGVDASYDYAAAQEYGTEKTAANPFFWPAYRFAKKPMRNRILRALRKALREAWK